VPAVKVLRPLPEAPQVDDSLDAGACGGGREVLGATVVALDEVPVGPAAIEWTR